MKIPTRFYLFCTLAAFSAALVSCSISDELDKLNSINSIEASGSFNANILNTSWVLKDLMPTQKLNLIEDADGNYSFSFENSSDNALDKVTFPTITLDPINMPLLPLNALEQYRETHNGDYFNLPPTVIDFEIQKPQIGSTAFSKDATIKAVKLKDGAQIIIAMDIDSNSDTQITVSMPSLTKDGVPYSKTFDPIIGSSTANLVINDLDGYILSTDPKMTATIEPSVKKISSPINGNIKATLTMDIADHNEYVEGFFGEMTVPVAPIEFPLSIPGDIKGTDDSHMILKEITMTLKATKNGFNFPIDLDVSKGSVCYYKGNNTPTPIEVVAVPGVTDENTFKFIIKNVNVLNIEKFVFNPVITMNEGLSSGDNKITDVASINYTITTNLPLDMDAEDLAFEQEEDNSFFDDKTDVNESDYEFKDGNVILKGSINSEIPIGATLQVYYRDNSNDDTYLAPLFDQPLSIAKGLTDFNVSVSKQKLDEIKKHQFQVIKITFNGAGAIMSNQKINIKLGLAVKGTIKAKI